ncbi:sensor histidine kinase [Bradyrhizobium diazoefficiens]|uniref:sensor histidine kinase n=1 Tax=Bradyrhizobium diazoefficiens TaxID=1355477 RepID=UPI00272D188E|nr:ATP-binding protein [Bradyrhizobium diazoefficiens]WLA65921.1 ATP-binding protein [Bradyrhizobium diazoefficiens]
MLVFVVDITERKQAQDALLAAQAELAHAARVATLGELSASIAHEVNQPLAAIVTSGEAGLRWLRRDVPDLKEVATTIGHVVAQGRRASEIVTRIRTFLKKAAPQQDLLQIGEVIEEATALVARELAKDDVALIVEPQHGLPPVRGRIQLQQVLVNLLINASQAMSGRPGSRVITLRAGTVDSETLAITVRDSGPGIPPDDMARLFDPFFTTKDGMGLAICRTTLEAHGGRLSVVSTPGSGATFHLTLPYSQEHASP